MNEIERLINDLCPDGVEYKKMSELGSFYGGLSGKSKNDFSDGNAKFITYVNIFKNSILDLGCLERVKISKNEKQNIVQYGNVLFTGSSETVEECGMSSVLTEKPKESLYLNSFSFGFRLNNQQLLLPGFCKYIFRATNLRKQIVKTASGVTRFNVSKKKMENVIIPVPPLEIQEKIVEILDKFTELTAELKSELEARKQQYKHYRDSFLAFDNEVESVTLGKLADINVGSKPDEIYEERNKYEYINAGTTNSGYSDSCNCEGDSITTPSRGQGGIGFVGYQKDNFWLGSLCYRIKSNKTKNILTKYLYYYLQCNNYLILKIKNEGGVPAVNKVDLVKLPVVIPDIKEQERIVSILDCFDTLVNNPKQGLPAEIELSEKRYSYYRDKLLTFKRKHT